MIDLADRRTRTAVDARIDRALERIRERTTDAGAPALAAATVRAAAGGKRFRPALVAATFAAWHGSVADEAAMHDVAAAVELLHAAFVVHDDVVDHDTERRGEPNVSGEFSAAGIRRGWDAASAADFGLAAGLLAGDLLLHEAERTIALADLDGSRRRLILDLFDDAVVVSAAGELADVENALSAETRDPDELLRTAHDKTAIYSFSVPLCAGAVLAGASSSDIDVLHRCGGLLGLAFQVVDDLIGAFGTAAQAGREIGADLREAKRTPLIAFAQRSPEWTRVEGALALARTGPIAVREAQRALADTGARAAALEVVAASLDDARAAAAMLPESGGSLVGRVAAAIEKRIP